MRKMIVGSFLVGGLAIGSAGVAVLNPVGAVSSALNGSTTTTAAPGATDPAQKGPARPDKGALESTLSELVANGTLTQAQADAVKNGVDAKHKADPRGPGGPGRGGFMGWLNPGQIIEPLASKLGLTPEELKTKLEGGASVADLAKAKGIEPQSIIDEAVAAANTRIDQAVKDGKLTQDRADAIKKDLPQRIADMVNHVGGGPGFGHGKGHGKGGPNGAPNGGPDDTSPSTTQPSS